MNYNVTLQVRKIDKLTRSGNSADKTANNWFKKMKIVIGATRPPTTNCPRSLPTTI